MSLFGSHPEILHSHHRHAMVLKIEIFFYENLRRSCTSGPMPGGRAVCRFPFGGAPCFWLCITNSFLHACQNPNKSFLFIRPFSLFGVVSILETYINLTTVIVVIDCLL
jgi:hypothetical protein